MKRIVLLAFTFLVIILACSSDNDSPTIMNEDFYTSYYEKNILPSLETFREDLVVLKEQMENFKTSSTDVNYQKMTSQWLVCAKSYSKSEVYNIGYLKELFYYPNIYNYPIDVEKIESNISQASTFDQVYFNSQSTVTKGLATIEFLLYGNDFNIQNAKEALLNNTSRFEYLLGVTDEVLRQTDGAIYTWQSTYFKTYIKLHNSLCTENAKCLTINQIINVLDMAKVTKIGKPFGFEKSDNVSPEILQAYRSRNSLLLIEAMLKEVRYLYFDSEANLSELVDGIDKSKIISNQIQQKFDTLEQQIASLNSSLFEAVSLNPQDVSPIYVSLKEITTLFSVDVTSTLSVTTLPTDNDGD